MSLVYQPLQYSEAEYTVYKLDYSWNKNYKHNVHAIVFYYSMIDIPELLYVTYAIRILIYRLFLKL